MNFRFPILCAALGLLARLGASQESAPVADISARDSLGASITTSDTPAAQPVNPRAINLEKVSVKGKRSPYKAGAASSTLRLATPLLETPQNIQVVTAETMKAQRIFDMREGVTRNISGAAREGHWEGYARIYMRGSNIPALRNGMNVTMPWGPLDEDMSMVDRIEFVKGPAGFMLANGEPGGLYNVVTKKPTGGEHQEAEMTQGSYGTLRASADVEGKVDQDGDFQYRINAMAQRKGTQFDNDYNNRYSLAPVLKYRVGDRTSLTAEYNFQYKEMLILGANYQFSPRGMKDVPNNFTIADPSSEPTVVKDNDFFLTLNHAFNDDWALTMQAGHLNYDQRGYSTWPEDTISTEDSTFGNLSRGVTVWDALGLNDVGQIFVNGAARTGPVSHKLLAGLDMGHKIYYAQFGDHQVLQGYEPFNIYHPVYGINPDSLRRFDRSKPLRSRANYRTVQQYTGLYLQDELGFWEDRIRLTLAGRLTFSDEDGVRDTVFTPRAGLSVSLGKNTSVYALYDQSFVPQGGSDFSGKPFKPLTGDNIEGGIKRDWFDGKWNSTLAVYQITKNDILAADPEHILFSVQLGQTTTVGTEIDIKGEILPGLDVSANYAFTDSWVSEETNPALIGKETPGTIMQIANGWLSYRRPAGAFKGLGASAGVQWQGDRYAWYVFDGSEMKVPDDYLSVDAGLSWQAEKLSLSLNVNNVFDEYLYDGFRYTYSNYYAWNSEPGRNYRVSVGYRFK
jgi:iron complex outermembrane receptor protein